MPKLELFKLDRRSSYDYKFIDKAVFESIDIAGVGVYIHRYEGTVNESEIEDLDIIKIEPTSDTSRLRITTLSEHGMTVADNVMINNTNTPLDGKSFDVLASPDEKITFEISVEHIDSELLTRFDSYNTEFGDRTSFDETEYDTPSGYITNTKNLESLKNTNVNNIQDFMFLENRDRVYSKDTYYLKGSYNISDIDFDLSQFGFILQNDTMFVSFHMNSMVEVLGRKLMAGDVLEFPHLKDDYTLDPNEKIGLESLKRFYVVQEGTRSSEGFSQLWTPHLWRVKTVPMVDSTEYRDILGDITNEGEENSFKDFMTTYHQHMRINNEIIAEAEKNSPGNIYTEWNPDTGEKTQKQKDDGLSGRNTSHFWIIPGDDINRRSRLFDVNNNMITVDGRQIDVSQYWDTNVLYGDLDYYLSGDGVPPNGFPVTPMDGFPESSFKGQYILRTDFLPNRLFVNNGGGWTWVEDDVEMTMTNESSRMTSKSKWTNNKEIIELSDGNQMKSRQPLNKALQIKED